MRVRAVLTGVVCVTALAACGSGSPAGPAGGAAPTTATSNTAPTADQPSPTAGCPAPAGSTTLDVPMGSERPPVIVAGTGSTTVVLSNQSDEDHCAWLPYAATLVTAGYRVVLWDYAGTSGLDTVAQADALVPAVVAGHPGKVVLLGASQGAKTSIVAAAKQPEGIAAVVALSAEARLSPSYEVAKEAAALRAPVLLVTAEADPYGSTDAGPQILAAVPGADKKLVTVPGSDHGTALLDGASGGAVRPAITEFLARVAPPA